MKKFIVFALILMCVLVLVGCNNKSMDDIIQNKPSVTGIVEEVHDDYFIMYSETAEGYPNGSRWSISLNAENKDSYIDVVVGDEVVVYYDGTAMETDPLRVSTVFAITLKTPADRTVNEEREQWDLIPMVMVNGELYLDTGIESTVEVRCGVMDGEITSTVDGTEQPTKDNESNFGIGYGYQYGFQEGTIDIYMNDKWWIFATEEARQKIQFPTYEKTWGITLTAESVTPSGLTIRCIQSGGEPAGELNTGSWYILENWTQENEWKEMPYVIDGEIAWTSEARVIPMNDSCEWEVNWEWLYGQLPAGKYRVGKEIMDFKGLGDFDKAVYYAEFVIESTDENPEHSDLYVENYILDDVLSYFEEVVLHMEYSDGTGDVTCVQKWLSPIYYQLYGSYTDTDVSKLKELFTQLNNIEGFPGIYPATDTNCENLTINFLEPNDFMIQFSDVINGEDAYGAAEFWYYTETNEIYTARIGYRTDIDQNTRNSILLEEIINVLGISDSELRTDSIVYQYSNENTVLSDVDILIFQLLYNPKIECGMNYDNCTEIIKELYY